MTEELRKCLSEILVNAHKAFDLIPLPTNKEERRKIDDESYVDVFEYNGFVKVDSIKKEGEW